MKEEHAASTLRWDKQVNWWLLLIAPAVLAAATVAANMLGFDRGASGRAADWLETLAPYMAATGVAIYAVRAVVTGNPLFLMLTVVAASILMREIDWTCVGMIVWTHRGIYTAFVVVAIWMVLWRKKIAGPLRNYRYTSLLIAAVWAFFFSQLVARRIFSAKHLAIIPNEKAIHIFLEEAAETTGHVLWVLGAIIGSWRRGATRQKETKSK